MADLNFNINSFRSKLSSGARPNLFEVSLTAPSEVTDPEGLLGANGNFKFLCRSAAIPSMTLGIIEVPFRGRRIKIPGDRTFTDWTVTVINDEAQGMRAVFDNWMAYINNPDGTEAIRTSTGDYRCTVTINHLDGAGEISRQYQLFDAFPTDVSPIDLSYDNVDVIQEFTVTFQYHYMEAGDDGATVSAAG